MTAYIALLRAVNVGGTGKLPMSLLVGLCTNAGFADVRTYIASGNAMFRSDLTEHDVKRALEARLRGLAGKSMGVLIRSAEEMAGVVAANPFADQPGSRIAVLFTDEPLPTRALDGATGLTNEDVRLGTRALFVFYPDGMGRSRLRLPAARAGTSRNMNTVAKLAQMAARQG